MGSELLGATGKVSDLGWEHLNRLLRTWLGFSPKRLARITRFQALLQRVEDSPSGGLAQLAVELSYYDQPYLTNEVAKFAAVGLGRIASRGMADFSIRAAYGALHCYRHIPVFLRVQGLTLIKNLALTEIGVASANPNEKAAGRE